MYWVKLERVDPWDSSCNDPLGLGSASLAGLAAIHAASARLQGYARRTPVLCDEEVNAWAGCRLWFKAETLQRAGAFKFRGAFNAVAALSPEERARGIVTQSSGNHGAALALACQLHGAACTVVAPETTAAIKVANMRRHGARVVFCGPGQRARDDTTAAVLAQTGGVLVHPFDHPLVIAGQGTAALELLDDQPQLSALVAPVSGGGLLAGTAIAAKGVKPGLAVFGAEPTGADDAHRSLVAGQRLANTRVDTVCDGLRADLGALTFPILQRHVSAILLVDDVDTLHAMRLIWEHLKLTVEPSCAIALAAVRKYPEHFADRDVGLILSGGNVDLDRLPEYWAATR